MRGRVPEWNRIALHPVNTKAGSTSRTIVSVHAITSFPAPGGWDWPQENGQALGKIKLPPYQEAEQSEPTEGAMGFTLLVELWHCAAYSNPPGFQSRFG